MAKKSQREAEPEPVAEAKRITPVDIQQKEFRLAFRGYNERDVDQFLDEVTEEVARLYAENKRLKEEVEFARTTRLDLGRAEEAEAVVRQAREEAERLLSRARAASLDPQSGPTSSRQLAPFVTREREFLQSLANLIQRHAEGVKEDLRRAREQAAGAAAASRAIPSAAAGDVVAEAPGDHRTEAWTPPGSFTDPDSGALPGKGASESGQSESAAPNAVRSDAGDSEAVQPEAGELEGGPKAKIADRDEMVKLPDPGPAADVLDLTGTAPVPEVRAHMVTRASSSETPRPSEPGDDESAEERSLRELFWGEE